MRNRLSLLLILLAQHTFSQPYIIEALDAPKDTHFRGLSVVDDNVAWVSGTKGWVGVTIDGGKTWSFNQIKDFGKFDFRTLYGFNGETAIAANAGSPASVLRTTDGGKTWKVIYKNEHKDAFFDGVDFWNDKEGIIYGDPIDSKMLLLKTTDGGVTWKEFPEGSRPVLSEGEASFAASGTGIRCVVPDKIIITTGGKASRVFVSEDKGNSWKTLQPPVLQGGTMTGMYSVAFLNAKDGIVVGGDYERDSLAVNHIFYTNDSGKTWHAPVKPTRGLRECIEYISPTELISTGLPGSDYSTDGGKTWLPLSDERNIYVVRKARRGSLILMCGASGKLKRLHKVAQK